MQLKHPDHVINGAQLSPRNNNGDLHQRQQQATAQKHHTIQQDNYQYYEQYKRLYQTAYLLSLQLRHLSQTKDDIHIKIGRMEKKTDDFKDDIRGEPPERKKRFRRTAEQIEKKYVCTVQRCQRNYGSEGSLQQHIKLKHPQLYQSKSVHNRIQNEKYSEEDILSD